MERTKRREAKKKLNQYLNKDVYKRQLLICRRGNKSLSQAKLIYAAILSAAVSVVFTLAPLAVFAFSCGLSDISVPLQALDGFAFCRFDLSIGSYLLIFILVRTLTITVVSVILAAINRLFMSEAAVLAAGSLFLASGLLLSLSLIHI